MKKFISIFVLVLVATAFTNVTSAHDNAWQHKVPKIEHSNVISVDFTNVENELNYTALVSFKKQLNGFAETNLPVLAVNSRWQYLKHTSVYAIRHYKSHLKSIYNWPNCNRQC